MKGAGWKNSAKTGTCDERFDVTAKTTTGSVPSEHLTIVIVGHVDHGKSTLLGRLYADTGSLPEGKLEKVQAICRQQGKEFEYAFLFDAFLEEQEQGITIDTARTFFGWKGRQYILIDAPGHKEFLKNMVSGAARAEAALLIIDAEEGVKEQSRKHGLLLSLLGVKQVAVVVNKMDLVGYRQDVFEAIEKEYRAFLDTVGVKPDLVLPASAKLGDNVVSPSTTLSWYQGPSVLDALGRFRKESTPVEQSLRFPVQDVYKFDGRRIIAGRISAGRIRVGDRLVFSPSNKTAQVKTIEAFNIEPPPMVAQAGESIGVTLDEQIFVERGEVASHEDSLPMVSTSFRANLFWLGDQPLECGKTYLLRLSTQEMECRPVTIHRIVSASDLGQGDSTAVVKRNEVAELTIRTTSPMAFDVYSAFETTGRFVLIDRFDIAGGGILTVVVPDEQATLRDEARERDFAWVKGEVRTEERTKYYGHRAAIVLLTGPALTSKSFLARKLESLLVAEGSHAYLLEGENLRHGLDADLRDVNGRSSLEIVRRYGEVARLFIDAGMIVVSTTNTFGVVHQEAAEAIRTLVYPAPVVSVFMSHQKDDVAPDSDLLFLGPEDFDTAARQVIEELKRTGVLMQGKDRTSGFQYSI